MSAIASPLAITSSPKWIISQRDDLIWFIGSALAGYLALAAILISAQAAAPIFIVWLYLINGPHFYATATRTYFDGEQRRKLSVWLWMILPFSIIPAVVIALGGATVLFVIGALWGTFHIAKQHVGIMMLYKRKNNDRGATELDKRFLLISQLFPLGLFVLWYLKVPTDTLFRVALSVQLALAFAYLYRQVIKYRNGQEMNWPKLMLMSLVIPLHWLAFVVAANSVLSGILIFTIATNIGHALQYHRLTWFHNHNRYKGRLGLSGFFSRSAIYYYGAAFGLSLTFFMIARFTPVSISEVFLLAPTFMHYFLDSKIWRTREDPALARALNVA